MRSVRHIKTENCLESSIAQIRAVGIDDKSLVTNNWYYSDVVLSIPLIWSTSSSELCSAD